MATKIRSRSLELLPRLAGEDCLFGDPEYDGNSS
jgi:hypothetical protein